MPILPPSSEDWTWLREVVSQGGEVGAAEVDRVRRIACRFESLSKEIDLYLARPDGLRQLVHEARARLDRSNRHLSEVSARLAGETDQAKRKPLLVELQRIIEEDEFINNRENARGLWNALRDGQ